MGDMAEVFRDMNDLKKERRKNNAENSLRILNESNITYDILSSCGPHIRIGDYDFWASTGLFINLKSGKRGRGVFNLIKMLNKDETTEQNENILYFSDDGKVMSFCNEIKKWTVTSGTIKFEYPSFEEAKKVFDKSLFRGK